MCSICHKQEHCKSSFKDIAEALRFDYILTEYNSLSDAWRVYQGVALYREYRGIGGETKQLDVEPKPCQLCLVKIVNMAQAVYVVTSTVETGVTTSREVDDNPVCESPTSVSSTEATQNPKLSPPNQPGTIRSSERWSTDSKERWSTSPVKKQNGGHNGAVQAQVPVNQALQPQAKTAAKIQGNKNRRESPLTKSKEASTIKSKDSKSLLSASKESQTSTQTNSRPKRSGRSFIDRNPDFHMDISLRGDGSETDSLDGLVPVPPVPSSASKKPKKQIVPLLKNEASESVKPCHTEPDEVSSSSVSSLPSLSETRPKRSTGRSLFERNPDFAMDIPFAKVVEQKLSQKGKEVDQEDDKNKKVDKNVGKQPNKRVENEIHRDTGVLEVVIEPWKTDQFRAEHLAKLDHALSSAGWSQAIRSGKNMEKEVFKNSNTEAEYVAGITRLVAHFNRGNSGIKTDSSTESSTGENNEKQTPASYSKQSTENEKELCTTAKTIKLGNEKLKSVKISQNTTPVLKEKRVAKPTKKFIEKKIVAENSKVVKKVAKTWSKTKVNCPMCGQLKLKTKMKEHILVFHKSSPQFPCIDCEFKSTTKSELEIHIKTVHEDLNPEGNVSESEGSVASLSNSSTVESKGRANAVRSQFQYIVKTSKSGKQGRKYIQVGSEEVTDVPDVRKSELKTESRKTPTSKKILRAKKVTTPGSKLLKSSQEVDVKQNGVLQYMKEDGKSRVHEVFHEASVSEKVVDEFAGSSSESEFSEPRSQIVGTLNAYYMNKNCPDEVEIKEDVTELKIDSVKTVTPVKNTVDVKDNIVDDVENNEAPKDDTRKENMIPNNERPQRRKRSIEDIHPDFVMDMPRSVQKGERHLKKGKQENEEVEVSNVAKNWFEVNQGDEF